MKAWFKKVLQKTLGFDCYLFLFAIAVITTLRWNRNERDFLHFLKMIPNEGTVLDIGANIGIMSAWFGRRLPHASIIAFEPIPQNIKALKSVLRFYRIKNVEVVEKAVGNHSGEVEMVMPVLDEVKMQGLSHIVHESIHEFNEGARYRAPIIKLDEFESLCKNDLNLTAIKLDVENFEYYALAGARELILRHKPFIYTELWDNENRQKCFELLASFGYTVKVLSRNKLTPYNHKEHSTQNFFFVP
jgi:FkbM family methyltransferase